MSNFRVGETVRVVARSMGCDKLGDAIIKYVDDGDNTLEVCFGDGDLRYTNWIEQWCARTNQDSDLLTALRALIGWQLTDDAIAKLGFDPATYKAAFDQARAAIAKAEGEAP